MIPRGLHPMNIQDWFPLGLTDLISLLSKGLSRVFPSTTVQRYQFLGTQPSLVQLSHLYMTTEKNMVLPIQTFVHQGMSLFCNMLSRFVIAFLPRSKRLLISWLQSPSAVILLLLLLSHFSCVRLCATPETAAHQVLPSLGFSRREHWSGLPLPSPIVDLQCCVNFCYTAKWLSSTYIYYFYYFFHYGLSQGTE